MKSWDSQAECGSSVDVEQLDANIVVDKHRSHCRSVHGPDADIANGELQANAPVGDLVGRIEALEELAEFEVFQIILFGCCCARATNGQPAETVVRKSR